MKHSNYSELMYKLNNLTGDAGIYLKGIVPSFSNACRSGRSLIALFGLALGFLTEGAMAWPPLKEHEDYNYNRYLQQCREGAGSTVVNGVRFTNMVEFIVEEKEGLQDQTSVRAELYFLDGDNKRQDIAEETLVFEHRVDATTLPPSDEFYLDEDGTVYHPQHLKLDCKRPAIPEIGLDAPLMYTKFKVRMEDAEVLGLCISKNGSIISVPSGGYYCCRDGAQINSPYLYSDGNRLFLTRYEQGECDLINVESGFRFSFVGQTWHELVVKPDSILSIIDEKRTVEFLYSNLEKGLYKEENGSWTQVDSDLRSLNNGRKFAISHPTGSFVQMVKLGPPWGTNTQALTDLQKISYKQYIPEINFNGRVMSAEELEGVADFLKSREERND